MGPRRYRKTPLPLVLILLLSVCLLAACHGTYDTELLIEACLDQDGNRLPPGVMVTVNGVSAIWSGEPLRFPLTVHNDVELVTVRAGAGGGYVFNSKSQYAVPPGRITKITLRFFRPYDVVIKAFGQAMAQLSGVDVYANGRRIGTTDENGRFLWRIDQPLTRAGPVRPGARFHIWLECNGQSVEAQPIVLQEAQYSYSVEAQLDSLSMQPQTGACSFYSQVPALSKLS